MKDGAVLRELDVVVDVDIGVASQALGGLRGRVDGRPPEGDVNLDAGFVELKPCRRRRPRGPKSSRHCGGGNRVVVHRVEVEDGRNIVNPKSLEQKANP